MKFINNCYLTYMSREVFFPEWQLKNKQRFVILCPCHQVKPL